MGNNTVDERTENLKKGAEITALGKKYYYGTGVSRDCKKAFDLFSEAAELGDVDAYYCLGVCYATGNGVGEPDIEKKFYWTEKAAENGHTEALYHLGCCYRFGWNVVKSAGRSVYWLKKAADLGVTAAKEDLGSIYEDLSQMDMAISYYKSAIEENSAKAKFSLGKCYENGKGVARDLKLALVLYEESANGGYITAQNYLADIYEEGEIVEKDLEKSAHWQKIADESFDKMMDTFN